MENNINVCTNIRFTYRFHPAGQGLFASGTLSNKFPYQKNNFHWVFDCGSMALKRDLSPQISWYRDLILQKEKLDLLCISHFDYDHVSGLSQLLDGMHIDTVVIPYYTPYERLLLGAMQTWYRNMNQSDYFDFLSNPVAFIFERAASVGRVNIIHRLPPDNDNNWPFNDNPNDPLVDREYSPQKSSDYHTKDEARKGENDDDNWSLTIESELSKKAAWISSRLKESPDNLSSKLQYIGRDACFSTCYRYGKSHNNWEFLFFHKPEDIKIIRCLKKGIDALLNMQSTSLNKALQNKNLRNLIRDLYRNAFPGSKRFNTAGLCSYSGPIFNNNRQDTEISTPHYWHGFPPYISRLHPHLCRYYSWDNTLSILYSGDADFKPVSHRKELKEFLTDNRWESICILQIPHHGSKNNWQEGSANEFSHIHSVISADPLYKHHHPDKEVLLDLLNKNPLLVDRHIGVAWSGIYWC